MGFEGSEASACWNFDGADVFFAPGVAIIEFDEHVCW
jgi:hypothetical protein